MIELAASSSSTLMLRFDVVDGLERCIFVDGDEETGAV